MYFYLIRHIAMILNVKSETDSQPFYTIFNDLKTKTDVTTWAPYLQTLSFRCEGTDMIIVPEFDTFKIQTVSENKVVLTGEIKNCTVIKELEGASQVRLCVLDRTL